jgi:hypothetical protein
MYDDPSNVLFVMCTGQKYLILDEFGWQSVGVIKGSTICAGKTEIATLGYCRCAYDPVGISCTSILYLCCQT